MTKLTPYKSKSLLVRLLPIYSAVFTINVSYSLMLAVLTPLILNGAGPLVETLPHHQRAFILGGVLSLYPIGEIIGSRIYGMLSDVYGRRPLLLFSLGMTTLFCALVGIALHSRYPHLLLSSCLFLGMSDATGVCAKSAIADITQAKKDRPLRSVFYGYVSTSTSFGFICGPVIGVMFGDHSSSTRWVTYGTPFFVASLMFFLSFLYILLAFPETKRSKTKKEINFIAPFQELTHLFSHKKLGNMYLSNFMVFMVSFGFLTSYPIYIVHAFKLTAVAVSSYMVWLSIVGMVFSTWVNPFIAKRYQPGTILLLSLVAVAVCIAIVVCAQAQWLATIGLTLTSIPLALGIPALSTILANRAKADEQASVFANQVTLGLGTEAMMGFAAGALASIYPPLSLTLIILIALLAPIYIRKQL